MAQSGPKMTQNGPQLPPNGPKMSKSFVSQSLSLSRARSELRDWLTRPLLGSERRSSAPTLYATLIHAYDDNDDIKIKGEPAGGEGRSVWDVWAVRGRIAEERLFGTLKMVIATSMNLMMINSLKTVPKCHFTRSGELNISKLNRWFWSWCWCCSVCLTCIYIMRRRDHQLSPNKTDIQQ